MSLVPCLLCLAADPIPEALEIQRGTWVLKGFPDAECIAAMKRARVAYVISICRDGDAGFDANAEGHALAEAGILFSRVALKRAPTAEDFELFRMVRNSLPPEARVLVHCTDGNRAAVVAVAYLAAEGKVKRDEAVALARKAGMIHPETEKALKAYLGLGS
jgi:protein tyrosine phosphatase (PTP) superfamily phosphohydrolase (DUF442 family)